VGDGGWGILTPEVPKPAITCRSSKMLEIKSQSFSEKILHWLDVIHIGRDLSEPYSIRLA
jgi:hypothetical protein